MKNMFKTVNTLQPKAVKASIDGSDRKVKTLKEEFESQQVLAIQQQTEATAHSTKVRIKDKNRSLQKKLKNV